MCFAILSQINFKKISRVQRITSNILITEQCYNIDLWTSTNAIKQRKTWKRSSESIATWFGIKKTEDLALAGEEKSTSCHKFRFMLLTAIHSRGKTFDKNVSYAQTMLSISSQWNVREVYLLVNKHRIECSTLLYRWSWSELSNLFWTLVSRF